MHCIGSWCNGVSADARVWFGRVVDELITEEILCSSHELGGKLRIKCQSFENFAPFPLQIVAGTMIAEETDALTTTAKAEKRR